MRDYLEDSIHTAIDTGFKAFDEVAEGANDKLDVHLPAIQALSALLRFPHGAWFAADPDQVLLDESFAALQYDVRGQTCQNKRGQELKDCVLGTDSLLIGLFVAAQC